VASKSLGGHIIKGDNMSRQFRKLLDIPPETPAHEPLYITNTIDQVLEQIHLPSNITLITHLSEEYRGLRGDSIQLKQAIINIIRNAIQAMKETGGILAIESLKESEQWFVILISDTGVGIPAGNLEIIFDPLFTTRPRGIGLGLSITQSIVEAHRGSIVVESMVGKGSSFSIRLPFDMKEQGIVIQ
jgi:signal transduction histidine kinase